MNDNLNIALSTLKGNNTVGANNLTSIKKSVNLGDWINAQIGKGLLNVDPDGHPITSSGGLTTQPNYLLGLQPAVLTATSKDNIFLGNNVGSNITRDANNNVIIGKQSGSQGTFRFAERNTIIGYQAGVNMTGGDDNVLLGTQAGNNILSGSSNILMGWRSGYTGTTITGNIFLGSGSGSYLGTGSNNIMVGATAGYYKASGNNNILIGNSAGRTAGGVNSVMVGSFAGRNNTGGACVFLGHYAGFNETGADKLYISNSDTANPLIKGDFSTGVLEINSTLVIKSQTAAAASALTPAEGMLVNVSTTDGTFTSTGLWLYQGAAWTKFTVV